MRRLDECWRKADDDHKGILPCFFFHFGVPHKYSDYTVHWFEQEIVRLIDGIEKHFNVKVTDQKLRESIRLYNRGRELLRAFDAVRTQPNPPIDGVDALAIILAGTVMPRADYNDRLSDFLDKVNAETPKNTERIRLMLVGSANDDTELVRTIEGDRAVVVADNLCFGARFQLDAVAEEDDPIRALTSHYLRRNECPRMYGAYEARLSLLREKIKSARIDGLILQNIRFCDLHGAENGLFERDLEAEGIPCLRIEREYGPLVEKGRLKIRVDAFLERISREQGERT